MLRSLTLALIEHETIKTTPARAKELRWFADRVITFAKRGDVHGRRQIISLLGSTQNTKPGENRVRTAIDKVYTLYVPRFQGRQGGYTQIIRMAKARPGDNADMCVMRYIPGEEDNKKSKKKGEKKAPAKESKKELKAKADKAPADKAEKKAADKKPAAKAKKDKE